MIDEQHQQQQTYQSQPFTYDSNKTVATPATLAAASGPQTAVSPNIVPPTKANGFANVPPATATVQHHQQQQQSPPQQPQQQQQQIDKVTGLPVPAPRRSNSIPLGDGPPDSTPVSTQTPASTALVTAATSTPSTSTIPASSTNQNGTIPHAAPSPTAAAGTTSDPTETQVGLSGVNEVCLLFPSLHLSLFAFNCKFPEMHAFHHTSLLR